MATAPVEMAKLDIPSVDLSDTEGRNTLVTYLQDHRDIFGVKTLLKNVDKYAMHTRLAEKFQSKVNVSIPRLRGERTASQRSGDSLRSKRLKASGFFNSLNTTALKRHCRMYELDFDSYESIEDIVEALTEKHLEMNE